MKRFLLGLLALLCSASTLSAATCSVELFILGAGQDAGAPQIGNHDDPAWAQPEKALLPTSLAVVDYEHDQRFLFEATPAISTQLKLIETMSGQQLNTQALTGIFLTHAHIGHYAGLMYLGREAAGAQNVPVYGLPRMMSFLKNNGPWSQLVEIGNVALRPLQPNVAINPGKQLSVTAIPVPHRDEYSETAGFMIETSQTRALFVPDIDSWDQWLETGDNDIALLIERVNFAFVDATFFDDNELPGRDMSAIPHPRVAATMERLATLRPEQRAKVVFIHYNHTNPIRFGDSTASRRVTDNGFRIARRGDRFCLVQQP